MSVVTARPQNVAKEVHHGYYSAGSYPEERYAWTAETFLSACQGKRILEVGCGNGKLLKVLKSENEVYGVDASEDGIAACASEGIGAYCLDVCSEPLPFADGHFDFVICLETLEHMMNPYYALMEMRRVLRPGGELICSVPNPAWGHIMLYPGLFEFKHFRRFLQQCDFRIVRVKPWEWAPRELILPAPLRRFRPLRSRYVAGVLRRSVERICRAVGFFPAFCYWLWTFQAVKENTTQPTLLERQMSRTSPKGNLATLPRSRVRAL